MKFIQSCPFYKEKTQVNTEFYLDGKFIHYRAGTNHHNISLLFHKKKTKAFNELIQSILK